MNFRSVMTLMNTYLCTGRKDWVDDMPERTNSKDKNKINEFMVIKIVSHLTSYRLVKFC